MVWGGGRGSTTDELQKRNPHCLNVQLRLWYTIVRLPWTNYNLLGISKLARAASDQDDLL